MTQQAQTGAAPAGMQRALPVHQGQNTDGTGFNDAIPQYVGTDQFAQAAQAQGNASQALTNQQTVANRSNQTNPFGSSNWSQDPNTGQWTQNVQLAGAQNDALSAQQNLQAGRSEAAQGMLGQATSALSQGLDTSHLNGLFSFGAPGQVNQQAQDAVNQQLQPQLDQRRKAMENQLANQGITQGSEAWTNAQNQLARDENNAHLQAVQAGFTQGNAENSQNINYGNFLQQQNASNLAQQQTIQQNGLNNINALTAGQQVQAPTFGQYGQAGVAQTPNYLGAAQSSYNQQLDSSNANAASTASRNQGLYNLGSAFLGSSTGQNLMGSAGGYLSSLFGYGG